MTGLELQEELRANSPDACAIVMAGRLDSDVRNKDLNGAVVTIFVKPRNN